MTRAPLAVTLLVATGCGQVAQRAPDASNGDGAGAAPGSLVWQRNMFGSFPAVTLAGDQPYVSASQFAPLDLGKGVLTPVGGQDVLAARLDADGRTQWSWRHGGASDEFQIGMSIDPFGQPAIAGLYRGTGNAGGADLPATTSFNGFVASYTEGGALRWQVPLTATSTPTAAGELFPRSSSTNGSGNTGVAGHFTGVLNIGSQQITSAGGRDAYYVRASDAGSTVTVANVVTFGGTGDDTGNAAIYDPLGTLILVGTFSGQVKFGTFMLDAGTGRDVFVVRADRSGTQIMWAVRGGGASDVGDLPVAAVTSTGDVVIADAYQDTFQLTDGDTVRSMGTNDIALAKISSAGKVLWTRTFGGTGLDFPRAVAVGGGGDIALTGEFNGMASFGGSTFTSAGFIDSFVAKYTGNGDHVWSHASGSAADDRGLGVAVDSTGAVYYTGSFHNTVSFGGDPLTASGNDFGGVLVKYSP